MTLTLPRRSLAVALLTGFSASTAAVATPTLLFAQASHSTGEVSQEREASQEGEGNDAAAAPPISTARDELGDLLRRWWTEGTAAGNVGDWYDNRDRGHSDLRMEPYPQLSRVEYSKAELDRRADWAAARMVRQHVTFGNSSTSAPVTGGGSNPRHYYTSPRGLELLAAQYRGNNLYIYPEHRDHDPGHNGLGGGYGDLYHANTPYVIISQGSSGSDRPFMQAVAVTLAAFRPAVKRELVETGLLMPTLQMILRSTNKHLEHPLDYLTGKAHPTVFDGKWVDPLAMARAAHAIRPESLPPLVKLRVVEEGETVAGRDFFDPAPGERFSDTESAVVRLFRGRDRLRRMTVSVADSFDANDRPLTFTWTLLRGDPHSVRIEPLDEAGTRARIEVAYPARRPVAPGGIESNRVDIGVFAHNGVHFSPPAFVSFFSFDSEARTYDQRGRVLEIGYGMGEVQVEVKDWPRLMRLATDESPASGILPWSANERKLLAAAAEDYAPLEAEVMHAREAQQSADKAWREAQNALRAARSELEQARQGDDDAKQRAAEERLAKKQQTATSAGEARSRAQKEYQAAEDAASKFLERGRPEVGASLTSLAEQAINELLDDPDLCFTHRAALENALGKEKVDSVLEAEWKQLASYGLGALDAKHGFTYTPLRANDAAEPRWTAFEKMLIRRANLHLLEQLLPADVLMGRFMANYVDPRLTTPKNWRDVYRYHDSGALLGWTRYAPDGVTEFNPYGEMVLKRDEAGRCLEARTVKYAIELASRSPLRFKPLAQKPGNEVLKYKYDSDKDFAGRVVERVRE